MKYVIVSIKDLAVGAFMRPFFAPSTGAAVRSFGDEVKRADSEMAKHPEDYELYKLGEWDDSDGAFVECRVRESGGVTSGELERIARGVDYVQK